MEERQDLQKVPLSPGIIRQGFANQLKELTLLNTHSPRIFIVYAHSLDGKDGAEESTASSIAKEMQGYLQPTILAPCPSRDKHLDLNVYSAFSPQGKSSDSPDECKRADMLYRQLGLLPKHAHSVDYVVVYGSHSLQEYSEIKEVNEYTSSLRRMLSAELSKPTPDFHKLYTQVESALHVLKSKCNTDKQQFHSLYTELALLTLRQEERYKESLLSNDVITLLIDRNPVTRCSSMLQDNSIYMGTVAGLEQDPKTFCLGIFELLSRLFGKPELGACRTAIDKAHSVFITNTNLALWREEDVRELTERHSAHEERKIERQRTKAKNFFFALSASSEEEFVTDKASITAIDTAELTEVLQATYQQDYYAKLPRLFSEETEAIADTFVNVAILKEEVVKAKERELDTVQKKEDGRANDKEIQDNRLQSHERLYEVHETIAIGELFAPLSDTHSSKKLLLYGRAGIGKTVLCQYIVNQWAEKSDNMACFSQFQAVFWIPLRELLDRLEDRRKDGRSIQRKMLVAEMVTTCCLRDSDWQGKTKKQQLQQWLKANAESTLFILDGYDEIAETAATPCILSDCLDAVLNETQYKPYVMLTSRPVAIDSRYSFDRRLECMGFIDENIPVFVSRYMHELEQSNACLTFLKTHSSIWGTAHVPIHLELICWLWSRGELSLRSEQCLTMAALYTEIVGKIGIANYNKHPLLKETCLYKCYDKEYSTKSTTADFANDFLSFLGFHAMQQEGVLLSGKEIKEWAQEFIRKKALRADKAEFDAKRLLTACLHLGLLKSTRQEGKDLFDHTYYFIHLSFQEFFAAKYYQQAFEHSDTKVIEHFRVHKYTPSYQLTWWMSAGLLYQNKNDFGLRAFFETLTTQSPLDLVGIHHANLLSHCLDECQADETVEVVAQSTRDLAQFLPHLLERDWLAGTWGKTLLHCSNLLRAKSFQDKGLYLFKKLKKGRFISSNTAALLSHLTTQAAIACLTNQAIFSDFRTALAQALVQCFDLTVEQVKSLFACVRDITLDVGSRVELTKAFIQRSDLSPKQIQSLFACVTDTTLDDGVRVELVKAFVQRSDLSPEQIQSLFACVADTTLDGGSRVELTKAFIQRSDLSPEQIQSLFACVTDTTLDDWVRIELARAFVQYPDLTPKQVQSLITCITDTTLDSWICVELAKALVQHLNLTAEQEVQSLIACVADTTIDGGVRVGFAQALVRHSGLISEQIEFLIACITDMMIDSGICQELAQAFAQALVRRYDLAAEKVQSLIACVTNTTIHGWARLELTQAFVQHPNLTIEQIQSFVACVTNTTIHSSVRKVLAQAHIQRSDLTAEQVQSLVACVTNTTLGNKVRVGFAQALVRRSDLTAAQVQSLIACITNTTLSGGVRIELAQALVQHSDVRAEQVQSFIACITNTRIDSGVRIGLAKALIQRFALTAEQVQSLCDCITDTTIDGKVRVGLAQALMHSDLTAEQVQSLCDCVTDTTIGGGIRVGLAKALVQRSNLTADQVQSFFACVADTRIGDWICGILEQRSNFNMQQSQQALVYCLKNEMICEEYPFLIFSILRIYYSTNQTEQHTVLSDLSTFLTRPSTWSALAKQQALFLYDEANGIALLRLGTQTMEIPLHLNDNPFLTLSHQIWGGSLHSSIEKEKAYTLL